MHSSLSSFSPRDSSLLLPPLIAFPFLAVVCSSFSRSSRVSSARWCYFRASVLCKCRTLALRCRFRCRARSIGQAIIFRSIVALCRGYHHLIPSNSPCAPGQTYKFCCKRFMCVVCKHKRSRLLGCYECGRCHFQ